MQALEAIREVIRLGCLEVRPNGQIWKLAIRDRGGNVKAITPKRAENTLKSGYLGLKVEWMGKQYLALAHRVVWEVLHGAIPESRDVNHIDGDKTNNRPSNLELATRSQNIHHAYRTGLRTTTDAASEVSAKAKELRAKGMSYARIGKELGVSQTTAFRAVSLP